MKRKYGARNLAVAWGGCGRSTALRSAFGCYARYILLIQGTIHFILFLFSLLAVQKIKRYTASMREKKKKKRNEVPWTQACTRSVRYAASLSHWPFQFLLSWVPGLISSFNLYFFVWRPGTGKRNWLTASRKFLREAFFFSVSQCPGPHKMCH